jgi:hypothetical protein
MLCLLFDMANKHTFLLFLEILHLIAISEPTPKRVWLVLLTLDQESGGEGFSGVPHYLGPRTKMQTTALAVELVSLPASPRPSKKKLIAITVAFSNLLEICKL